MLPSEIVQAIVAYAGPLDDPRIGWTGTTTSHPDMFKCERCGAEHLDCTKIEHKGGCSAKALLDVLAKLRPNALAQGSEPHSGEASPGAMGSAAMTTKGKR